MLRIIRQLFSKKKRVLGPYRGYIGSVNYNGTAGEYQGEILNIPKFWNERVKNLPDLLKYRAWNKQMLERRFKEQVDHLIDIIDSFWDNQKTGNI